MSAIESELTYETEDDRVINWRIAELERAGYDEVSALEVALATDVDLHRAIGLVRAGCPVDTAVRILL